VSPAESWLLAFVYLLITFAAFAGCGTARHYTLSCADGAHEGAVKECVQEPTFTQFKTIFTDRLGVFNYKNYLF
jgi:hypothetical protein